MKRKLCFALLILTILVYTTSSQQNNNSELRLGTAVLNEEYYQLGLSISRIVANNCNLNIEVISTEGSTDNLFRLHSNEIDLAIVQNDVAFFAENGLYPFTWKENSLTAIMSLYFEPIFIITNNPNFLNLSHLANRKVNVGPQASGLLVDANIILNSSNLWNNIIKYNYDTDKAINKLLDNELQFVFTNIINDKIQYNIDNKNLFVITLQEYQINNLISTHPYFTQFNYQYGTEVATTVAVKSMLICRNSIDNSQIYELTKAMYDNYYTLTFPQLDSIAISKLKNDIFSAVPLKNWHPGAAKFYKEIDLLLPTNYLKYLWIVLTIFLITLFVLIIMEVVFLSFNFKFLNKMTKKTILFAKIKNINLLIIKYKYLLVVITMFTVYVACMLVIQSFEHQWALEHNRISGYDNQSFFTNLVWLFVFGGSGYSDNLFPHSMVGKIIVTIIPIIGISGFITIVSIFTSDRIKKKIMEARGMMSVSISDHIIICGWNRNVPFLIKNLLHDNIANKRNIVVLADLQETMPLEKYNLDPKMVTYIKGDSTNREDLEKANMKDADIAIIVHDLDSSDPDAKNVLKILTIEKYGHELEKLGLRKNRENIYTIAEIQDAHVFEAAKDAYVDEIISLGHIKSKIFIQAVQNPGVSKFIDEILTYNEFNDLYSITIKAGSKLYNKTYSELLTILRKHNILILSINIENHREKSQVKKIMERYNLKRSVLTNPIHKEENEYKTNVDDNLIVLAQYEETITNALKIIEYSC